MAGNEYQVIFSEFNKNLLKLPSLTVKNMLGGSLNIFIGYWGDITKPPLPPKQGWTTRLVKTLNPGQTWSGNIKNVDEFSEKTGEWLIIRPQESAVAYRIENRRSYFANFTKTTPQKFPLSNTTFIIESRVDPFSSKDSILSPNEQDVVYYFVIG